MLSFLFEIPMTASKHRRFCAEKLSGPPEHPAGVPSALQASGHPPVPSQSLQRPAIAVGPHL